MKRQTNGENDSGATINDFAKSAKNIFQDINISSWWETWQQEAENEILKTIKNIKEKTLVSVIWVT